MQENKNAPLITIHVSVFNLEKYIEQCLDSILTQDFDDYELILVDNGSTDRSIEICEKYVKKYPDKIKYKKFPLPTRIGRPYTYALSHSKGDYFMSVDGDDYLVVGCLKRIADIIQAKHPDVIMGTYISEIEQNCSALRDTKFDSKRLNGVPYQEALDYLATVPNFHTVQWRFIISRHMSKSIGKEIKDDVSYENKALMKEMLFGDARNVMCILSLANSLVFMQDPFYVYRCRKSSLTAARVVQGQAAKLLATLIVMDEYPNKGKKNKIQNLLKSQQCKFFNLFKNICVLATEDEFIKMADLVDSYKDAFLKLREFQIDSLNELCDLVIRYGTLQGLMMFGKLQEAKLLSRISAVSDKNIYVFPTGMCGESTLLLLNRWKLHVNGFLDNDPSKEALLLQNSPCMLPERLKTFSDKQKQDTAVVIATSYEYLIPTLKEQLISLGILTSQIIIKE